MKDDSSAIWTGAPVSPGNPNKHPIATIIRYPAKLVKVRTSEGEAELTEGEVAVAQPANRSSHLKAQRRRGPPLPVLEALADVWLGFLRAPTWWELAKEDLQQRFERTSLGVFWLIFSYAAFLLVYIFIFGQMRGRPADVAAQIALSFLIWSLINGAVLDGTRCLIGNRGWIKGMRLPFSLFAYQAAAKQYLTFFLCGIVTAGVVATVPDKISKNISLLELASILLALFIFAFSSIWTQLIVGTICARYRDLEHLISTGMRVAFFLTPVIWEPSSLGPTGQTLALINPFSHFIEIVRYPILHGEIPALSWYIVLCVNVVGFVAGVGMLAFARHRLVFWL